MSNAQEQLSARVKSAVDEALTDFDGAEVSLQPLDPHQAPIRVRISRGRVLPEDQPGSNPPPPPPPPPPSSVRVSLCIGLTTLELGELGLNAVFLVCQGLAGSAGSTGSAGSGKLFGKFHCN